VKFAHTTIAVAGTHSTGKSTFLDEIATRLRAKNISIGRVVDTASRARSAGFPILREHVYESTLWIMAEGLRQEMEAALKFDVVLVDRPLLDAYGYLLAALTSTGRDIDEGRRLELEQIAVAHQGRYDWFATTILDKRIPLGPERDPDAAFREIAAEKIAGLVETHVPTAHLLSRASAPALIDAAVEIAFRHHR
jgi:AAA domain